MLNIRYIVPVLWISDVCLQNLPKVALFYWVVLETILCSLVFKMSFVRVIDTSDTSSFLPKIPTALLANCLSLGQSEAKAMKI